MMIPSASPIPLKVAIGVHVVLELIEDGDNQRLEFDLVSAAEADYYAGFLGENTPLGQALLGQTPGSRLTYFAGSTAITVHILEAIPSTRSANPDREQQRQNAIQQAVAESQLKDRIAAATAMSNKWGDIDPGNVER